MIRLKRIWEGEKKLKQYIEEIKPKKVLIPFGHGLGDLVMFLSPWNEFTGMFPEVEFTLSLQKGLGFEELKSDIEQRHSLPDNQRVIFSSDLGYNDENVDYGYDVIADIDFPMNEGQTKYTKGQWCCIHELGFEPMHTLSHQKISCAKNRLIAVQFHITCLPGACNPDRDTAEMIWNDILDSGFIPIEMHFQHCFHNPVNKKFDFIDATVRRCRPQVSNLAGLIDSCAGVVSVVTGNLHVAISLLPPERIFFLEKDFKLECFTKEADKIARADLRNYNHEVKTWLAALNS